MIRLILADDHVIVRVSLRSVLEREPDIEVVGEAGDGEAMLVRARELAPDLVLMDIAMPLLDGMEVTRRLLLQRPDMRVIAYSSHLERRLVRQMLAHGALGYVSKNTGRDELLRAVRSVAAGKPFLCQETTTLMAQAGPMSRFNPLS